MPIVATTWGELDKLLCPAGPGTSMGSARMTCHLDVKEEGTGEGSMWCGTHMHETGERNQCLKGFLGS